MLNKDADVVIIGGSKANHSYITERFASDRITAFNGGIDGTDCYVALATLKALSSRKKPSLAILDIADRQVEISPSKTIDIISFLYGDYRIKGLTPLFDEQLSSAEKLKLRSNLYRYNKIPETMVAMLRDKNKTAGGYVPLPGQYVGGDFVELHDFAPNEEEVHYLSEIVSFCSDNDIKLVFSISPSCINNLAFNKWLKEFCENKNVSLINSNNLYWNHLELFHDDMHLNKEGSELFTEFLLGKLSEDI